MSSNRFIECLKNIIINCLKKIRQHLWYTILLLGTTIFLFIHKNSIIILNYKEITTLHIIFIFWIILLVCPLFSEIEILGVKIKKEVDKIKDDISNIKTQILQSNSLTTNISISNELLPSNEKLKELEKTAKHLYSENTDKKNIYRSSGKDISKTPWLHKIYSEITQELSKIIEKIGYNSNMTLSDMIEILYRGEILDGLTIDLLRQIIKITSRGLQGEIISNEYINFIEQVYPDVQHKLDEASNNFFFISCPRCRFAGYSKYENVCPQCGYTFDE